jgi:hypothetical protein
MPKSEPPLDDTETLRAKLFRLIDKADAREPETLKALEQCHSHIQNRLIVEQALRECGLRPTGFKTDRYLELYYDVAHGRREIGYIAKGWDEPGFRIGDMVEISRWKAANLKEHVLGLLKYCATRGVALTVQEHDDDSASLEMDSVIYAEGFNPKVLAKALATITRCAEMAHRLFEE